MGIKKTSGAQLSSKIVQQLSPNNTKRKITSQHCKVKKDNQLVDMEGGRERVKIERIESSSSMESLNSNDFDSSSSESNIKVDAYQSRSARRGSSRENWRGRDFGEVNLVLTVEL